MTKRGMIAIVAVLLLAFGSFGVVYGQSDTGYPVDETEAPTATEPAETETPAPTETEPPAPTEDPTAEPTEAPTENPTEVPTDLPTEEPTDVPTEPTETPLEDNPVCDGTREHPILAALASRFEVPYEELVDYYCSYDMGIGEIALALTTIQQTEGTVDLPTLLAQRTDEDLGWGEIWQNLGLIGRDHGGLGLGLLKKDQERNRVQDQITNEGEDDAIQNEEMLRDKNENPSNSAPGQEKKDGGEFMPPGQEGKTEDGKPGNGPKP